MVFGILPFVLPTEAPHARLTTIMALFLFISLPVWFLFIVSFYRTPSRGWRGLFLPFLGGLLIGMVTLVITLGLLTRTPFGMDTHVLYRWAWLRGPGWPMIVSVPLISALYLRKPTSYSRIREIAAWLSGAASVYMLWYAISPNPGFDIYRLFFYPFLWIGSVGAATLFVDRGLRLDGWLRYILLAAALGFSSLITFLQLIYTSGEIFYAFLTAVIIAAAVTLLAFLDSRGRLG